MGGTLGSALGLGAAAPPGWACMASEEQLSQLIMAYGCWGEEHKVVSPSWTVSSALSLLAQRDSSEFLLTCQTPGSGSFARRKTGVGGSQTAWRAWLCLVCCPAPRFLHDGQHHTEHWLSLPPVLLPRPWHLLQVPMKIRSSLWLCLHPCAQPLQGLGRPPCFATLPTLGWATSHCPCMVPLLEIKA